MVEFELVHDSGAPMFITTLRIDEDRTSEELQQAPAGLDPPDFVTIAAQAFEPLEAGETVTETLAFAEPGEYAIVCPTATPPTDDPVLAPATIRVTG